jgi:hypothetical protein
VRKFSAKVLAVFLGLLAFCAPARAATVIVNFSGQFTGGALAGSSYTGFFSYSDGATTPNYFQPGYAQYNNILSSAQLTVNGTTYALNGDSMGIVMNNWEGADRFTANWSSGSTSGSFQFFGGTNVINSTSMPPAEAYSSWNVGHVEFANSYGNMTNYSVVQAVPEPSTWLMMILGFGIVGYSLRNLKAKKLTPALLAT